MLAKKSNVDLETALNHVVDALERKYGDPPQSAMMQAIEVIAQPTQ
jgi:hypothetical protein